MPQAEFKLTFNEKIELYNWLFNKGCIFIPNINYKEPKLVEIHNIEEMIKSKTYFESLYILHPDFQFLPLKLSDRIDNPYKGSFYSIENKIGGPYISISCYPYQENDNEIIVIPDNILHHADFWTADLSGHYRVPEELKVMYKEILKYIKRKTKVVRRLLQDGSIRIQYISKAFFEEARENKKKLYLYEDELEI